MICSDTSFAALSCKNSLTRGAGEGDRWWRAYYAFRRCVVLPMRKWA